MVKNLTRKHSFTLRRVGLRVLQATTVALMIALALPSAAAEERAVKSRVSPAYPELAKRMKITGVVKVEATVDADGKVTDVKSLGGNHMLSQAAEDAVRKWRFEPGAGTSVVDVDLNFAMSQ
jgi:TonB family protein